MYKHSNMQKKADKDRMVSLIYENWMYYNKKDFMITFWE